MKNYASIFMPLLMPIMQAQKKFFAASPPQPTCVSKDRKKNRNKETSSKGVQKFEKIPKWVNVPEVVLRHLPDATLESLPSQLVRFPLLERERGENAVFAEYLIELSFYEEKFQTKAVLRKILHA